MSREKSLETRDMNLAYFLIPDYFVIDIWFLIA